MTMASEADTAARFCSWLLEMGFPRSPSRDHLLTICRGNYRLVWENLMKNVKPRSEVRRQRLQVFAADINHCRSFEDDVHERIGAVVTCEQLEVWKETQELRARLAEAESLVSAAKQDLSNLVTAITEKVTQREHLNEVIKKTRRQSYTLHSATEQFQNRSEKLSEMTLITNQLAPISSVGSNKVKPDEIIKQCISLLNGLSNKKGTDGNNIESVTGMCTKLNSTALSNSTAISNSSIVSETERRDQEFSVEVQEKILELLKGVNIVEVWDILHKMQDELISFILNAPEPEYTADREHRPQFVVADTSALHCKIILRTLEMKQRTALLQTKLVEVMKCVTRDDEDEASRELLVLQCEEASLRGRVNVLHDQLTAIKKRTGLFQVEQVDNDSGNVDSIAAEISHINNDIAAKKCDIEKLLMLSDHTGTKISSVVAQLNTLLPQPHSDVAVVKFQDISMQGNYDEFVRNFRPNLSETSSLYRLTQLKDFYCNHQTECRDLSLSLECSTDVDTSSSYVPRLTDELKFFQNNFDLNMNRKLVLPNGDSLWIMETLEYNYKKKLSFPLHELCTQALLVQHYQVLNEYHENIVRKRQAYGWNEAFHVDVTAFEKSYSEKLEMMMKLSGNSLVSLKQISVQLGMSQNNLSWWDQIEPDRYINECRQVNGKSFNFYHNIYKECLENKTDRFL